jgi:C1A family cysteine protease
MMRDGRIVIGKHPEYRVGYWDKKGLSISRKKYITKEDYNGEVFCAEMPVHHTLVTRRNGKILISGNCVSQSLAADIELAMRKSGKECWTPSRLFIYYNARVLERTVKSDSGTTIRSAIRALARWGFCPESVWEYDISKFTAKPNLTAYRLAATQKIRDYCRVTQSLEQLQACLVGNDTFAFGFSVYNSFEAEEVNKTGKMTMPAKDDKLLGGHAVLCVGYDNAAKHFIIRNSWSGSWGDQGYFYMPYDYILNPDLSADFWTVVNV